MIKISVPQIPPYPELQAKGKVQVFFDENDKPYVIYLNTKGRKVRIPLQGIIPLYDNVGRITPIPTQSVERDFSDPTVGLWEEYFFPNDENELKLNTGRWCGVQQSTKYYDSDVGTDRLSIPIIHRKKFGTTEWDNAINLTALNPITENALDVVSINSVSGVGYGLLYFKAILPTLTGGKYFYIGFQRGSSNSTCYLTGQGATAYFDCRRRKGDRTRPTVNLPANYDSVAKEYLIEWRPNLCRVSYYTTSWQELARVTIGQYIAHDKMRVFFENSRYGDMFIGRIIYAELMGRELNLMPPCKLLDAETSTGDGDAFDFGQVYKDWTIQVICNPQPTVLDLDIDGSIDGTTWYHSGLLDNYTTVAGGHTIVTDKPFRFLRAGLVTLANGASPVITVQVTPSQV